MYDRYACRGVSYKCVSRAGERRDKRSGGLLPAGLDASDIMLLMILYFLYRESGDEEFLIILAVVAMSIFNDG